LIHQADTAAFDVAIAEEGVTRELAVHQPRSRNSTTVLKRKGTLHDGTSDDAKYTSRSEKPVLSPESIMKRMPRRRPSPAVHTFVVLTTIFVAWSIPVAKGVPPLWPLPQNFSFQDDTSSRVLRTVSLAQGFEFDLVGTHNDHVVEVVRQAQSRFLTVLLADIPRDAKYFPVNPGHKSIWNLLGVHIYITTNDSILRHAVDESYRLEVRPSIDNDAYVVLTAPTVYGVLHGLATLVQLLQFSWMDESGAPVYRILGAPLFIQDQPQYPYRGLLIDTSRHYLPIPLILRNLDAMAWNKLNVLHWHIVDSQSWPYQSDLFPELTQGAFCTYCVYTPSDVKRIESEASIRGIRVVPEFDLPGHSQAIGASHKELMTVCDGVPKEPLDVTQGDVYSFVYLLYDEINTTFTGDFIHLGGDEVNLDCWHRSPKIQEWMRKHNMSKEEDLLQYFESRLLKYLRDQIPNKRPIVWQELFDSGLDLPNKSVIVDVWKEWMRQETITNATEQGFTVVVSSCWYLDHLNEEVENFYNCIPTQFLETSKQRDLVAGGHASMWGEHVDEFNFFARVYPRASAAAEKLWTGENALAKATYVSRLKQFRCLLGKLGIPSEPLGPGSCIDASSTLEVTERTRQDSWIPLASLARQKDLSKVDREQDSDSGQGKEKKENVHTRIGSNYRSTIHSNWTFMMVVWFMMFFCYQTSRKRKKEWLFIVSVSFLFYLIFKFDYAEAWRQVSPLFPLTRKHAFPKSTPTATIHQYFMRLAMDQARLAARQNEVPIGAIVVRNITAPCTEQTSQCTFRVLSTGRNAVEGKHDASAHAEIVALRRAGLRIQNWRLENCTIYSTLEPCAMCVSACQAFRIGQIVYGAPDLRLVAIETHLQLLNIVQHPFHNVSVAGAGVLQHESAELLQSFFRARRGPKTTANNPTDIQAINQRSTRLQFFQYWWRTSWPFSKH
jgi:hexosaminidase